MPDFVFPFARAGFVDGSFQWDDPTDTFAVVLLSVAYSPDATIQRWVSDIAAAEVSGSGYVGGFGGSGRQALSARYIKVEPNSDQVALAAQNVVWPSLNVGMIGGVMIVAVGASEGSSLLIAWIESGFPRATNGGAIEIAWPAGNVILLSS
jgi:hypothetical protein